VLIRLNSRVYRIVNLSPGPYQLEIQGEGSSGIYLTNILLSPAQKIRHSAYIPERHTNALISTSTVPPDAKLFIDDRFIGDTPVSDIELKGGNHDLKLIKDGFQTHQQKINILTNQNYHLNITLYPTSENNE
jgi:hypothetical protein